MPTESPRLPSVREASPGNVIVADANGGREIHMYGASPTFARALLARHGFDGLRRLAQKRGWPLRGSNTIACFSHHFPI